MFLVKKDGQYNWKTGSNSKEESKKEGIIQVLVKRWKGIGILQCYTLMTLEWMQTGNAKPVLGFQNNSLAALQRMDQRGKRVEAEGPDGGLVKQLAQVLMVSSTRRGKEKRQNMLQKWSQQDSLPYIKLQ